MNNTERNIQDRVQSLARDFMTIIKTKLNQLESDSESEMTALRDSLTFLSLMKDEFNRSIENKKNELLQSHRAKTILKENLQ